MSENDNPGAYPPELPEGPGSRQAAHERLVQGESEMKEEAKPEPTEHEPEGDE